MSLAENIAQVQANIAAAAQEVGRDPSEITLVAATKTQSTETIRAAIAAGITVCGENRVQEMTAHLEDNAYQGAELHFIGHLQTNKVKYVVGRVALIQSVGSQHLLNAIEAQAAKLDLVQASLGRPGRRGAPSAPARPDGNPSCGSNTWRKPSFFYPDGTAFC